MKNLTEKLQQFTCPARYYRYWKTEIVFTEGVKYLADKTNAYWLIENIVSTVEHHLFDLTKHKCFRFDLKALDSGSGSLKVTGEDNILIKEVTIEEINFPLKYITLFVTPGDSPKTRAVLMLSSEY